MDLGLNEMQEMVKRGAREFFETECPNSLVRECEQEASGYSKDLWQKMARQGWLGMVLPAQYGGAGASFLDLSVLYEEMGRALVPGPLADVVLSEYLLLDLGSEEQKGRYLPQMARGDLIATIAYTEPSASYDPEHINLSATSTPGSAGILPAGPGGGGYVLNGTKLFVPNAHVADLLLVVARTRAAIDKRDGLTVFAVPSPYPLPEGEGKKKGIAITLLDTIGSDRQCEVVFKDVRVPASEVIGPVDGAGPALQRYLDRAKALTCVWSVGGAEYVLEMTVDYAKNRVQFGRPIGTFQAVSHRCADMAVDCDGMRFVAYHAAWRLSEGLPAEQEVAIAKAWTGEAYRRVTASGHQVHGGVAYMMEHDMQMYYRRAKAVELLFGDGDYHRELVAQGMGL